VDVARLDARGELLGGSTALWRRWHDLALSWDPRSRDATATLVLGHALASADSLPLLMAVREADDANVVWIGEVDRDFLFGDLSIESSGVNVCVFDLHGHPVHCPGWTP